MVLKTQIDHTTVKLTTRPILKWAGGKTQLLNELLPRVPAKYKKYVEPFFGGGAMFFATDPATSVIADSNPELVNLYRAVAEHVEEVISRLKEFENSESLFYETRLQDWRSLSPTDAAARTIFLNKTCFNGLYRVNKKGQFNVPFAHYTNPNFCDRATLRAASATLGKAKIVCGDYLTVLREHAASGDFVFLDPPYLPISKHSDFRRYTREQFLEDDHRRLASEVHRLHSIGCHIVLTNSNHPLVDELYGAYTIDVIKTKRHISSNGRSRVGEDVIVTVPARS